MSIIKTKPLHQKAYIETKNKNIVVHSIKIYAGAKKRDDIFVVTPALQKKLRQSKSLEIFKALLKPAVKACKIDSSAVKANLANHARERQHIRNPLARALNLDKFIVEYSNPQGAKKAQVKKAIKGNIKKALRKVKAGKKSLAKKAGKK